MLFYTGEYNQFNSKFVTSVLLSLLTLQHFPQPQQQQQSKNLRNFAAFSFYLFRFYGTALVPALDFTTGFIAAHDGVCM